MSSVELEDVAKEIARVMQYEMQASGFHMKRPILVSITEDDAWLAAARNAATRVKEQLERWRSR